MVYDNWLIRVLILQSCNYLISFVSAKEILNQNTNNNIENQTKPDATLIRFLNGECGGIKIGAIVKMSTYAKIKNFNYLIEERPEISSRELIAQVSQQHF